jgi:hypothetical protein
MEKEIYNIKVNNYKYLSLSLLISGIFLIISFTIKMFMNEDLDEAILKKEKIFFILFIVLSIPLFIYDLILLTHINSSIKIYNDRIEYNYIFRFKKIININSSDIFIEYNKFLGILKISANDVNFNTLFTFFDKNDINLINLSKQIDNNI